MNPKYKKTKQALVIVLLGMTTTLGYTTYTLNTAYAAEQTQHTKAVEEVTKHKTEAEKKENELDKTTKELKEVEEGKKATEAEKEEIIKKTAELEHQVEKLEQDLKAKKEKETAELASQKAQTPSQSEPESDKPEVEKTTYEPNKAEETVVAASEPEPEHKEQEQSTSSVGLGTFTVTHYAVGDGMTPSTVTANGTEVGNTIYSPEGYRVIAVDTSVIPLNSIVKVTINGQTFLAKACDTGSAINGNKIDLLVSSPAEASSMGVTTATIELVK